MDIEYTDDNSLLFPTRIVTDRIRFESFYDSDVSVKELYAVKGRDSFEDIVDEMPGSKHHTMKETVGEFDNKIEEFESNEGSAYMLVDRDSGELIGVSGFGVNWTISEAQFYIWLIPEYQGRGYSVERGEAFMEVLFEEIDIQTVRVGASLSNEASQKAIEKYIVDNGGQSEGVFRNYKRINGELEDVRYYSITQEEWLDS